MIEDELTHSIIGAAYYVFNQLGYGFLESIYREAMKRTLLKQGHAVSTEMRVAVYFDGEILGWHKLDLFVDRSVVVEIKSTEKLSEAGPRQLQSYTKSTSVERGLLIHFSPAGVVVHRRSKQEKMIPGS